MLNYKMVISLVNCMDIFSTSEFTHWTIFSMVHQMSYLNITQLLWIQSPIDWIDTWKSSKSPKRDIYQTLHCDTKFPRPTSDPSRCFRADAADATGRQDTQFSVRTTWAIFVLWPTLVSAIQVETCVRRNATANKGTIFFVVKRESIWIYQMDQLSNCKKTHLFLQYLHVSPHPLNPLDHPAPPAPLRLRRHSWPPSRSAAPRCKSLGSRPRCCRSWWFQWTHNIPRAAWLIIEHLLWKCRIFGYTSMTYETSIYIYIHYII